MKRIYFIAKLFEGLGGGLIRQAQVKYLSDAGYEVTVITPNYTSNKIVVKDNIVYIPFKRQIKIYNLMEHLGLIDDYLDNWVKKAYEYLKEKIGSSDILFATCGGELGPIKLASLLKNRNGSMYIANFHDPIKCTYVNGIKINSRFHVDREKQEDKYLSNVDLIITSSRGNALNLEKKYPKLNNKIINNHFGYIKKEKLLEKSASPNLRIAYGGYFGRPQRPEILAKVAENLSNVKIFYIGNCEKYKPLAPYKKFANFIPYMSNHEYNKFMMQNIDVGFVSLTHDYFSACLPSKIFEYINLGIPILGALPEGEAMEIINENQYGIAYYFKDIDSLKDAIRVLQSDKNREKFKDKILIDRDIWSMGKKVKEILPRIERP